MKSGRGPSSQLALRKKLGIGQSTVGRILSGENDTRITTLDQIAAAYGLTVWQFLTPNLDPKSPPVLRSVSLAEEALYSRLREAAEAITKTK
jgi:transcriptional regulator with XRE-family HTH domain